MTPPDRPSITPEVVDRFAAYYRENPAWGSVHVVLDDHNLQHCSVDFCIGWAVENGDAEGEALARILRSMSRSQRVRLGRKAEAIAREVRR